MSYIYIPLLVIKPILLQSSKNKTKLITELLNYQTNKGNAEYIIM